MVDTMTGADKMTVVAFADKADVLCEFTNDRARLRNAIRAVAPVDTGTRLRDAMLVASSLQPSVPDLRVVVLSDGGVSDMRDIGPRSFDVAFARVGTTRDNAGIVAFSLRDPEEGQQGERQCLVLVHNE